MKKIALIFFILSSSFFIAFAQQPLDLWSHVYWQGLGNRGGQQWGVTGLDTLGRVADSVPQALSIGEFDDPMPDGPNIASYVLNRKPLSPLRPDTARIYQFSAPIVRPANFNGDAYKDFAVIDLNTGNVTVLLGTAKMNVFDTAFTLHFGQFALGRGSIVVCDCDSDGYDDLIVDSALGDRVGNSKIFWYRGSPMMDSIPSASLIIPQEQLLVGHVRDAKKMYLAEYYWQGAPHGRYIDTVTIYLAPLGKNFRLAPQDSFICNVSTAGTVSDGAGFALVDIDGDGIQDVVLGCTLAAPAYKGGAAISPDPFFVFHAPAGVTPSVAFGTQILDVGNFTGRGYHSLLITDPEESGHAGAVFVYNIGTALKDTCVADAGYGFSIGDGDGFGTQAAALGDVNGNGHTEFTVSSYAETHDALGTGAVVVFSGDTSYGPVGVHEPQSIPRYFTLGQNYPNPVTSTTDILFAVTDARLYGAEVTLDIYDMLGKKMLTAYRGKADDYEYTIRVDASGLPAGDYYYRLACGGEQITRMMSVIK